MSQFQLRPVISNGDSQSEIESKQKMQITVDLTNKMLASLDKNIQFHSKNRYGASTLLDMDVTIYVKESTRQIPKINFGYSGYTEHFQEIPAESAFPDDYHLNYAYESLHSALSKTGFNNISKQTLI